jgi:hypothetical protein
MDLWRRLTGGPRATTSVCWYDAFDLWVTDGHLSVKTQRIYRCALARCFAALDIVMLRDLQPFALQRYAGNLRSGVQSTVSAGQRELASENIRHDLLGHAPAVGTVNACLTGLRRFLCWCAERGWLDTSLDNQTLAILLADLTARPRDALRAPSLTQPLPALLEALSRSSPWRPAEIERNVALFALAWLTGARPLTLSRVSLADVRQDETTASASTITIHLSSTPPGTCAVAIAPEDAPALFAYGMQRLHFCSEAAPQPGASEAVGRSAFFSSRPQRAGHPLSEQQVRRVLHDAAAALALPMGWHTSRTQSHMPHPCTVQQAAARLAESTPLLPSKPPDDSAAVRGSPHGSRKDAKPVVTKPVGRAAKLAKRGLATHLAARTANLTQLELWSVL